METANLVNSHCFVRAQGASKLRLISHNLFWLFWPPRKNRSFHMKRHITPHLVLSEEEMHPAHYYYGAVPYFFGGPKELLSAKLVPIPGSAVGKTIGLFWGLPMYSLIPVPTCTSHMGKSFTTEVAWTKMLVQSHGLQVTRMEALMHAFSPKITKPNRPHHAGCSCSISKSLEQEICHVCPCMLSSPAQFLHWGCSNGRGFNGHSAIPTILHLIEPWNLWYWRADTFTILPPINQDHWQKTKCGTWSALKSSSTEIHLYLISSTEVSDVD